MIRTNMLRFALNHRLHSKAIVLPQFSRVFDEKSDVVPVEGNIIMLMEMSFTREQAIKALKMTDNNIEQAVDWIFDHPGDMHQKLPMRHSQERSDGKNEYDQ